jgi:hypothetical protein
LQNSYKANTRSGMIWCGLACYAFTNRTIRA